MKNLFALVSFLLFSASVFGQVREDVDMIIDIFKTEKKSMVQDYLELDEEQAKKFWPIYDEYEEKRKELVEQRIAMLGDYADHHSKLSDAKAKDIADQFFSLRNADYKMQKKYFKKISKAIGATKATYFIQLEEYIRTAINYELDDVIPFVGED